MYYYLIANWQLIVAISFCLFLLPILVQLWKGNFERSKTLQKKDHWLSSHPSLTPDKWTDLQFVTKTQLSNDTALYRFNLKHPNEKLDIPTGHYIEVKVVLDGHEEIRTYTPVHVKENAGHLDLIVKTYVLGQVSKYFAQLKPGDRMSFRGPLGKFIYEDTVTTQLGLIAGGSGITPILQVLNEYMCHPEHLEKVSLIYANETIDDILLKEELDSMMEQYPQFQVHYVLHHPPTMCECQQKNLSGPWHEGIGYISKESMEEYLPECADDHRLLICGPPEMTQMVLGYARNLGWVSGFQKSKGDCKVFVF